MDRPKNPKVSWRRDLFRQADRILGRGSYRWLRKWLTPSREYTQLTFARWVRSFVTSQTRWLDAGCGHVVFKVESCEEEQELIRRAGLMVGCDVDFPSIVRHRSIRHRTCCDMSRLPFRAHSFDLVTLNMVAEHLQSPEVILEELTRVLRPGGVLIIHTPNASSYFVCLMVVGRRLVPQKFVDWAIRFLEGRESDDVFPAFYLANTRESLTQIASAVGLVEDRFDFLLDRPLFYFFAPASFLEILLSGFLVKVGKPNWGASAILVIYRRPLFKEPADPTLPRNDFEIDRSTGPQMLLKREPTEMAEAE